MTFFILYYVKSFFTIYRKSFYISYNYNLILYIIYLILLLFYNFMDYLDNLIPNHIKLLHIHLINRVFLLVIFQLRHRHIFWQSFFSYFQHPWLNSLILFIFCNNFNYIRIFFLYIFHYLLNDFFYILFNNPFNKLFNIICIFNRLINFLFF